MGIASTVKQCVTEGATLAENPTLYVITAYQFNHIERPQPIDPSFFSAGLNSVFYFVDPDGGPRGFEAPI